jgi:MFS family permease
VIEGHARIAFDVCVDGPHGGRLTGNVAHLSTATAVGPYRNLLADRQWRILASFGLVGRFAMAMLGLGIVLLVARQTGSYATAGAAAAFNVLAGAFAAPQVGRLADRFGPSRVLRVGVPVHAFGLLGLIGAASAGTPGWVLCALAGVTGAALPPFGSFARALWARRLAGTPALHSAYALESIFDEIAWITGPALITLLGTLTHPAAGLLVCLACTVVGGFGMAGQPMAATPADHPEPGRSPLRYGLFWLAVVATFIVGATFGANDISVIAMAQEGGVLALGGAIIGVYATGSLIAGIAYGRKTWRGDPSVRFTIFGCLFAVGFAPLAFVPTVGWLVAVGAIAGAACSPILISGSTLVEHTVPQRSLTEALGWTNSALLVGAAAGSWYAGRAIEAGGAHHAFQFVALAAAVVPLAGLSVLAIRFLSRSRLRSRS